MPGGNVLLRRQQYRLADDPARSLELARAMVIGKVANARSFLLHARRDAEGQRQGALAGAADELGAALRAVGAAENIEVLRGCEGQGAKIYFGALPLLLKREEDAFAFATRSRRPPRDRTNAMLSFGYALLLQDCAGAAAGVGLDPAVGYLHEDLPGRLSLALDLMEELRVPVVDRLVVSLINRAQVTPQDFRVEEAGGVFLNDAGRKAFLVAYQQGKQGEVRHEFLDQTLEWGRVCHVQALLLARAIRGELDAYPPFAIR
jgi:CRISPR-associated protein Cas1